MIDWLIAVIYLGILLAWVPSLWQVSVLQVGVLAIAAAAVVRWWKSSIPVSVDILTLALIVLWGPFQIAAGLTQYANETWNASVQFLVLASIYVLTKTLLRDRYLRHRAMSTQIWVGSLLALVSVLFYFSSPYRVFGIFESRYTPYGPFIYKNQFAAFLELLLPLAFYRMMADKRRRAAYGIVFAVLFACMAASLSRGGMIIAIAETMVMAALCWYRGMVSGRALLRTGLALLVLVTSFTFVVGADAIWNRFREANPYSVRAQLARSTIQMIEAHAWAGSGLGTWRIVYPQFATFDLAVVANEAHNDWLQWASDGGIPFVLILLFFAVWVSRLAWKHLWGIGVPAFFVHCLLDYPTRAPALAALFFFFAGALAATEEPKDASPTEDPEWRVLSVRTEG